jgi:hypothetical protein
MSRLLQKRQLKKDGILEFPTYQTLHYDSWNSLLAKRFAGMFKNYRKFSIRYLGKDPMQ